MKFWNIRVIEADSQEEAIEKLQNGEFDESDENCDTIIPESIKISNGFSLNLFRLYDSGNMSFDSLVSILESLETTNTLGFRFADSPLIYTVKDLTDTVYGYHRENKKLLNELIDLAVSTENLEITFN